MKCRKKQEEVLEAEQFDEGRDWPAGVFLHEGRHGIYTMQGFRHVNQDDWIITGPKGDKFPCNPKLFEQTYEQV